jgi:hypothetical protein
LNEEGWNLLANFVKESRCDLLILDPLVALMGGVSLNDNAAAGLLMDRLTKFAVDYNLAVVIAHHASKGRDLTSAEAAMGAATLSNMARISKSLDYLSAQDAVDLGIPPQDRSAVFRIVATKQNFAPVNSADRLYRFVSVDMMNADPPVYPHGDQVAVVEQFFANASTAPLFSKPVLDAAEQAIGAAQPPFAIRKQHGTYDYVPGIAAAVQPILGRAVSDDECTAVVRRLMKLGRVAIAPAWVPKSGHGGYLRNSLVLVGAANHQSHQGSP